MPAANSASGFTRRVIFGYTAALAITAGLIPTRIQAQADSTTLPPDQLTGQELNNSTLDLIGKPFEFIILGRQRPITNVSSPIILNGKPLALDSTGKATVSLSNSRRVTLSLDKDGALSLGSGSNQMSYGYGRQWKTFIITLAPPNELAVRIVDIERKLSEIHGRLRRPRPAAPDFTQTQREGDVLAQLDTVKAKVDSIAARLSKP